MPLALIDDDLEPASLRAVPRVARNCRLAAYRKLADVPTFRVSGEMIAYASPDSTYAVTRRLIDSAQTEILIGIYDFSADYMKDHLLNAMQRGVKVSLMLNLDLDDRKESAVFDELKRFGCNAVPAPSCASEHASYFPSSHEKVIVIDGKWTLVQSGNYSNNSIPLNAVDGGDPARFVKGNRDMGVAIQSKPLAAFFTKVLRSDIQLELDATNGVRGARTARPQAPDLVERVPRLLPSTLFPSKSFNPSDPVRVTPVLTPDNYMNVVPTWLESATKSIFIENQYIRSRQGEVAKLLQAVKKARSARPNLDVRIVLGKLFGAEDYETEKANVANMTTEYGLKLGTHVRYIDTRRFVHCHNKLVVVDRKEALVSSQNWSNTGVATNREAGVILRYAPIARYFASIFESDWSTAQRQVPRPGVRAVARAVVSRGGFLEVRAADYEDV